MDFAFDYSGGFVKVENSTLLQLHKSLLSIRKMIYNLSEVPVVENNGCVSSVIFDSLLALHNKFLDYVPTDFNEFIKTLYVDCVFLESYRLCEEEEEVSVEDLDAKRRIYPFRKNLVIKPFKK